MDEQYKQNLKNNFCNLGDYRHLSERGVYVSIHMGSKCNLNCTYCDRDAITKNISMSEDDIDDILKFIKSFNTETNQSKLDFITFYGGEPLLWIKLIDKIISRVSEEVCIDMKFQIVTNGLLILQNKWFFEKWNKKLLVSLSYDFSYQKELREDPTNAKPLIIDDVMNFLDKLVYNIELYYTVPPTSKDFFNINRIEPIVNFFSKHSEKIKKLSLILVRYTNKPNEGFIDLLKIPGFSIEEYFKRMKQFLEILYVYKIPVCLNGITPDIGVPSTDNYDYYVMSADGFLYPEYVAAEYHNHKARKGKWKNGIEIYSDFKLPLLNKCKDCIYMNPPICNDVHFYYTWADDNILNNSPCKEFTKLIDIYLNNYNNDLMSEKDLMVHILKSTKINNKN